jgi:hypothetical protein
MVKGMSADDKRKTIISLLQQAKKPYTLKDLEKIASKAGVVQNTVKDIVNGLQSEGLIDCEKIGATNWFWSFPSKDAMQRRVKVRGLEEKMQGIENEIVDLEIRKKELLQDRQPTNERVAKLEQLKTLRVQKQELEGKLALAKENDPEMARKLKSEVAIAKAASERWTDNTWALMDWMKKTHGLSKHDCQRQLDIKDDFDYPVFQPNKRLKM